MSNRTNMELKLFLCALGDWEVLVSMSNRTNMELKHLKLLMKMWRV